MLRSKFDRSQYHCAMFIALCASATIARAQMIQVQTPFVTGGDSYYESSGVNWSLGAPNFSTQFGGGNPIPFGIGDPNAGFQSGVGFRSGGFSGSLGFNFAQGSDRFNSVTVPSLTVTNGVPGTIFTGTTYPFVVGVTPVVSSYAPYSPLGEQYLANVRAQQAAESRQMFARQQAELLSQQRAEKVDDLLRKADEAIAAGNTKKSRNFLYAAKKFADGPRLELVTKRLQKQ